MMDLRFWSRQVLVVMLGFVSTVVGWVVGYHLIMLAVHTDLGRLIIGILAAR